MFRYPAKKTFRFSFVENSLTEATKYFLISTFCQKVFLKAH